MRTIFQSLIVLSASFFVGCEGNTDYTWKVTNDSSAKIYVWASPGLVAAIDSISISVGATETVHVTSQLGGNKTEQLPEQAFSSIVIVNANGDTMQSSYIDPGSWISEIEQIKKVPSQYEHTYTFVINDNDF